MTTLKIKDDMDSISTTLKLSSEDVCYLFERLLDRLSVNKSKIEINDITIELELPTNSYSKSKVKKNDILIDYLVKKLESDEQDQSIKHLTEHHHIDDDVQLTTFHNPKKDKQTSGEILEHSLPLRPLKSVTPTISPNSTPPSTPPFQPTADEIKYTFKLKKTNDWGSPNSSCDSSDFSKFDLSSPMRTSIENLDDDIGGSAAQDLELHQDDEVIIQSMTEILDETKEQIIKSSDQHDEDSERKDSELDGVSIIYEDDIEKLIKEDLGKIRLYNISSFSTIYNLYTSKDISLIIANSDKIYDESKNLRGLLLNYILKGIDKKIYEPYEKLWKFTNNLLLFNKSIKLFPCKEFLTTNNCTTEYCTYYHPGEDPIYEFMIKTYAGNLIEEFSNVQSNKDIKGFEEFCIKINNYIFYNTVCKKRNSCINPSCSCIHNINEQLLILHLWKSTWKSFGKRSFNDQFTYPSELDTESYKSLWLNFYGI